jgi:hypothetical protein
LFKCKHQGLRGPSPKERASKRNFASGNKTALGPQRQAETSLKIEDLRSNKTTDGLPGYNVNVSDDHDQQSEL